jgi:hypothetical protein
MAGTAGLFLTLGAVNAYAVPQNSPYATMVPPDAVDGYSYDNGPAYGDQGEGYGSEPVERRSAYVDPDYGYDDPGYAYPDYGYAAPLGGGLFFGAGHFGHGGHFAHRHFHR